MKKNCLSLLCIATLLLAGCDRTDDVTGIFLGKTWKLTGIMEGKNNLVDYWDGDEETKNESIALLENNLEDYFTLTFEGAENDGAISGTYRGRAVNEQLTGTWEADADNNSFHTNQAERVDVDVLATAFIRALSTAYEYEGDYNRLRIYFKEGDKKRYLLMFVQENR